MLNKDRKKDNTRYHIMQRKKRLESFCRAARSPPNLLDERKERTIGWGSGMNIERVGTTGACGDHKTYYIWDVGIRVLGTFPARGR